MDLRISVSLSKASAANQKNMFLHLPAAAQTLHCKRFIGEKKGGGETQPVIRKGLKSNCSSHVQHGRRRATQSVNEAGLVCRFLLTTTNPMGPDENSHISAEF